MKFYDEFGNEYATKGQFMFGRARSIINSKLTKRNLSNIKVDDSESVQIPKEYESTEPEIEYIEYDVPVDSQTGKPVDMSASEVEVEPVSEPLPDDMSSIDSNSYSKIEIDYIHNCVRLMDEHGNELASAEIKPELIRNTIDADLADVLFGDGVVPDTIHTNIESIPIGSSDPMNANDMPNTPESVG